MPACESGGYYRGSRQHPFARLPALKCSSPRTTTGHQAGLRQRIIDARAFGWNRLPYRR
jgi:hypothetical protein